MTLLLVQRLRESQLFTYITTKGKTTNWLAGERHHKPSPTPPQTATNTFCIKEI